MMSLGSKWVHFSASAYFTECLEQLYAASVILISFYLFV